MTEAPRFTQAEVKRAIDLEDAYQQGRPLPPERVKQAVDRLYGEWIAAGGEEKFADVLQFATHVAKTESPTAEHRGETRALWSFKSQPEGAPREVGHRFLAQACGESRGYQVLEDSPVGRRLDAYELWDENVQSALIKRFGLDEEYVQESPAEIWDAASECYAKAATGEVEIFAADIGARSVLGRMEMPRVLGPEGVGKEAVRFPVEFPHHAHLPESIYAFLSEDSIRCQLRLEDYKEGTTTPEQFAAKLGAIDVPEHLKQAHTAAVARLSAATSYEELTAPAAEATESEITQPEPAQSEPAKAEPEQSVPTPAAPAQPEPKAPPLGHSFVHGGVVPSRVVVPPRPRPVVAGTHGTINPVPEAAPKSPGIEQ
ncbi:hypothetical protein [Streptomyces sp. fd1-xmd]|uniref:hypothetical protein n=1 Tax=Streptomyces sp. fd1-xmd TaxID=1812480 RepID=UPI00099038E5|nr:hypothetical protein [Streptomyces sp. fd1-xmd]AQT73583.1 hypothetical protein B1K54_19805 [Streptomyces sp. fd1-xmd]